MTRERAHASGSEARFAAVRHLARRRIEEEVVVLDLHRSRIYGMNPSAGAVLEALQQPQTVPQIAARFISTVTEASAVSAELGRFLAELAALDLVARCPPVSESAAEEAAAAAASGPALSTTWSPPALLWQEEVARVTHQISPPQQIGNPVCLP